MKRALLAAALLPTMAAAQTEFNGKIFMESRFFSESGLYSSQPDNQLSIMAEGELYTSWNDGNDSLVFKPFVRFDSQDSERTHSDIRELMWLHVGDGWELRGGIGKVYWGVTESLHLVDVINQTDLVESVDGEKKLGQPMVHLTLLKDWGTIDAFVLPYFRESRFNSLDGRFSYGLPVRDDLAQFESGAEEKHIDFALRWSKSIDVWDIGLSYFNGTNRDADFNLGADNNGLYFTPYYWQMEQIGADIQATVDSWLWKVEAIHRSTGLESYTAANIGFEYTYSGVFDQVWDLGVLMEYQYDSRDEAPIVPAQNDLFVGARLALNDEDGTAILFGIVQDLERSSSRSGLLEASSRINGNWKWRIDAWLFQSEHPDEFAYAVRRDDFVQLALEYYF